MTVKSYRDLDVWNASMDLVVEVYRITNSFPTDERFGLISQLRRASVSIPSNLAEGHSRNSTREFLHHISIAMGSLSETETQITLAERLNYATTAEIAPVLQMCDQIGRQLRNLQKSLNARL